MPRNSFASLLEQHGSSSQDRQYAQLMREILDKLDERFSQFDQETQAKFREAAQDIARMQNTVEDVRRGATARFHAIAGEHARGGAYRGPFPDAECAGAFGKFVAAVAGGKLAMRELANDSRFIASVDASSGESGGFLMPEVLASGIVNNAELYGVFERNTRVWPVSGEAASRAKKSQGATVYYPDYNGVPTESELKFDRIRTELTRYSVFALLDNWMLNSNLAIALGDYVAQELGYALAYATDLNAFMGDGSDTYARVKGLFNLSGSNDVTADSGDDTFQEVIDETTSYLSKVCGALPDIADDEAAKFYLHRTIFWTYLGVKDSQDRPIADILTKGDKPTRTLMGYPAEVTQVAPKLTDTAVSTAMLMLANLQRGTEMYRHTSGMQLRTSEHYKFLEGQTAMVLDVPQGIATLDEDVSVRLKTAAS